MNLIADFAAALEGERRGVSRPGRTEAGKTFYLVGHDANFLPAHKTAWVFRAGLATVVGGE